MPHPHARDRAGEVVVLPEERVPFPVEPRYSVRPTLRRWDGTDRGHVRLDRRYPEYLSEKLRLLAEDGPGCRVVAREADRPGLLRALVRSAEALADDAPSDPLAPSARAPVVAGAGSLTFPLLGLRLERDTLELGGQQPPEVAVDGLSQGLLARVHAHLAGLGPLERLADALALAVQEDLVQVRAGGGPDDGPSAVPDDGRAELLHVCFPSAWDPAARAGAGFAALHAPVPHNQALVGAAVRVVQAMVAKGPFVRYVWSLSPDGRLDRNPRRVPASTGAQDPATMWFRVERQTVLPMPELTRALFTIRVYRAPLPAVLTSVERRRTLAAALASMDEALLRYKGVGANRDALLAYLGSA